MHSINTDGEITTQTPAKFRVIPQALQVIVPAT
jgi:diacylglycerol kinase family enzyme